MKFGYYADNELPKAENPGYETNSRGYRCPEFSPLPDGGKNVVVLGCSHTFGQGLDLEDIWCTQLGKFLNKRHLRFWNLGQPGASPDKCVRILYGSEKILFPKIIIICWPSISRRERLDKYPINLTADNTLLKTENNHTDKNNFLKCVFQVEKFAEMNKALVFHCFAEDVHKIESKNIMHEITLKNCWPEWNNSRQIMKSPSLANDGIHYGVEHHKLFAKKFYDKFNAKFR